MKRRSIKLDFSLAFQVKYSLVMMAGHLLSSLILYIYLNKGLGENYFESLMTLRNLEQALPFSLIFTFFAQLVLILLLTVSINLFVSHKIGGPVYRYEYSLNNILKGDLRYRVQTRKGDLLKSMVTSLNDWQISMRRVFIHCHCLHEEINAVLQDRAKGREVDIGSVRSMVDEVRQTMGAYCGRGTCRPSEKGTAPSASNAILNRRTWYGSTS